MLRKSFSILLLLLCCGTPISAHDAFYPHHREDFENMARRRELRTTVLLSTAAFLCVLGAVVYVALRKSTEDKDVDEIDARTVQEHLERATNSAVNAARQSLDTRGDIAEAASVCFTTYADMFGVTWRPPSYEQRRPESVPYQIRCKIGSDIVTLNIDSEVVQLKAEHTPSKMSLSSQEAPKSVSATVVLKRLNGGET
ncbi:hypothetical protein C6503_07750 [Candidatus Poribacteria bacterium]|nr:MAG: hypothetical protein C6503_07750 [Candidatus Poribacteria bacterium]